MTHANWRVYLSQARAEIERNRLADWVRQAEEAITARFLAVSKSGGHEPEIAELNAASEELRKIQIERLGYPDWYQTLEKEVRNHTSQRTT